MDIKIEIESLAHSHATIETTESKQQKKKRQIDRGIERRRKKSIMFE